MKKRLLIFLLIFIFTFSPISASASLHILPEETAAEEGFSFPANIIYGGKCADWGDKIFYVEGDEIRLRDIGSEFFTPIIHAPDASCLNVDGKYLYYISENAVRRCSLTGDASEMICAGSDLSCLYVRDGNMYFMSGTSVYSLIDGRVARVFTHPDLRAFVPLSETEFKWYVDNPDYVELESGYCELHGVEPEPEFLCYEYSTVTRKSVATAMLAEDDPGISVNSTGVPYNGPYIRIGDVSMPFADYMPGTYFTKNGKACTCHSDPYIDHVVNPDACNCMRYYPTGKKETCEVDLLGTQCFGFCRLVFWRCFGFLDHPNLAPEKYYSLGSMSSDYVTPNTCRELLINAKPGAHIRLVREHSMCFMTADDEYITVYHANAGGDGVVSSPCVVSTRRISWADFASVWAYKGIFYVNMPKQYPGDITVHEREYEVGVYRVKVSGFNSLNIRSGPSTNFSIVGSLKTGEYFTVTEIDANWGKTDTGWVCLDWCNFITGMTIAPSEDSIFSVSDDYIIVSGDRATFDEFCQSLYNSSVCGYSPDGTQLGENDYLASGSKISLVYDGRELLSKTVIVPGDINRNGIVDISDCLAVKRIVLGTYSADPIQLEAADVNRDGRRSSTDYMLLARYLRTGKYS